MTNLEWFCCSFVSEALEVDEMIVD